MQRFIHFLESLETPQNKDLLSTIVEGFNILYETPHIPLEDGNTDLHVEDKLSIEGSAGAKKYIKEIIWELLNNQTVDIDNTIGDEVKAIISPKEKIKPEILKQVLIELDRFYKYLK